MEGERARVRLSGGLQKTASWAILRADGGVTVEWYDYSEEAHRVFGNDVAHLVHVSPSDVPRLCTLLGAADADAVLQAMEARFADYFAAKAWLDEQSIPYQQEYDSWA
ncbi:MAG TPA: hypothetical protein VHG08_02185 [Longimicrobium sp.]|nr:hypothetical protein [Longimicrobium sp.]